MSVHDEAASIEAGSLVAFRHKLYDCFTARADALYDLSDAVLTSPEPVTSLAELSVADVHRRGHGSLYAALARGRIHISGLADLLAAQQLPRTDEGRLVIAIDVTAWPRPEAECSPQRCHCYYPCHCDGRRQTVPGWPYSVAVALEPGQTSWTAPLDARRLEADDDATAVTETQIREIMDRLARAGQLRADDPPVLFVFDAGYNTVRLSWLLDDLHVQLLGRLRSTLVMRARPGPRPPSKSGPTVRHGARFAFTDPHTWTAPAHDTDTTHPRYGPTRLRAFADLHPRIENRRAWTGHTGYPPLVEGTIIHTSPGDDDEHDGDDGDDDGGGGRQQIPRMWLWSNLAVPDTATLTRLFRAYLRRFDIEHTFRFCKQTLGLTRPRIRHPEQADRWVWLILAAYTQLRLARAHTTDLRRPWEKPLDQHKITPGRTRRGFRRLRPTLGTPARTAKPTRPGPGRPPGHTSTPAPRHPVRKKRNQTKKKTG